MSPNPGVTVSSGAPRSARLPEIVYEQQPRKCEKCKKPRKHKVLGVVVLSPCCGKARKLTLDEFLDGAGLAGLQQVQ